MADLKLVKHKILITASLYFMDLEKKLPDRNKIRNWTMQS